MNPASDTTMGNTAGQNTQRLRVTVGFPCPCTTIDVRAQYAVKFACYTADEKPLALVRGYYGTAINVHDPRLPPAANVKVKPTYLAKKVAEALPGETVGRVSPYRVETLLPDQAFEIDCEEIFKIAGFSPGFHTGFVVIDSDASLDVTAIYTGRPLQGQVSTMDVENVPERRMEGTLTVCPPTGSAEICISKFYDKNRDGVKQAAEPGLRGWTFQATDQAGNVVTSPPTQAAGGICFALPAPATYTISEVPNAGWIQTAPVPANQVVTVNPGGPVVNLVFGNWKKKGPFDDEPASKNPN